MISRPLLFATLAPELAEAKGVSLRLISVLFLAIVAVAVAEAAQVVGVLLVFALMVGPAAAALRLTSGLGAGIVLSVALALIDTWRGIALAYLTDWPPLLDRTAELRGLSPELGAPGRLAGLRVTRVVRGVLASAD